ncbi:hypothetical protein HanOQP8_Chr03g0119351 [Helianthus annuus]|nr:hypothetical protein HanOQP8_Chr03g0119351 [Helianthus annuus]
MYVYSSMNSVIKNIFYLYTCCYGIRAVFLIPEHFAHHLQSIPANPTSNQKTQKSKSNPGKINKHPLHLLHNRTSPHFTTVQAHTPLLLSNLRSPETHSDQQQIPTAPQTKRYPLFLTICFHPQSVKPFLFFTHLLKQLDTTSDTDSRWLRLSPLPPPPLLLVPFSSFIFFSTLALKIQNIPSRIDVGSSKR